MRPSMGRNGEQPSLLPLQKEQLARKNSESLARAQL
jgi:hypothetical protein